MKLNSRTAVIVVLSLLLLFLGVKFYESKADAALSGVRAAASDVEGALSVGTTFIQFGESLHKLATEILIAKDKGARAKQVEQYEQALQAYKDSYRLWDDKIQHPYYYGTGDQHSLAVSDLAAKYGVTITNMSDEYAKRRSYEEVTQAIWKKAAELVAAAK